MAWIWMWRSTWILIWIWNGNYRLAFAHSLCICSEWYCLDNHCAFFFCRNLPHVQYELYDACLARDPVTAMNKMGAPLGQKPTRGWRHQRCWERCVTHASAKKHQQAIFVFLPFSLSFFFLLQSYSGAAGFRPCLEPPIVPASCASCHDNWEIMMYKVHSGMGCSC